MRQADPPGWFHLNFLGRALRQQLLLCPAYKEKLGGKSKRLHEPTVDSGTPPPEIKKKNPVSTNTLQTTENHVVPMPGLSGIMSLLPEGGRRVRRTPEACRV